MINVASNEVYIVFLMALPVTAFIFTLATSSHVLQFVKFVYMLKTQTRSAGNENRTTQLKCKNFACHLVPFTFIFNERFSNLFYQSNSMRS